jgi:hypothetical protein
MGKSLIVKLGMRVSPSIINGVSILGTTKVAYALSVHVYWIKVVMDRL